MKIKYRLGDLPEWHDAPVSQADRLYDVVMLILAQHYHGREWPTTSANEWTTVVHLSTGESVRMRAKMRPQWSVDRYGSSGESMKTVTRSEVLT